MPVRPPTRYSLLFTYLQDIISVLQKRVNKQFTVFGQKNFKQNVDKCYLILCSKVPEKVSSFSVKSKETVKLPGMNIDNRFNFDNHVIQLCKKASKNCLRCPKILEI